MELKPTFSFQVTAPEQWLKSIAEPMGGDIRDNTVVFNNDLVKGSIGYDELEEGLFSTKINIKLSKPLVMERKGTGKNDCFILNFHKSNIQQTIANETKDLGYNSPYGLFFSSTHTDAIINLPADKIISMRNITVSKTWLANNILCGLASSHFLRKAVERNRPLLFYESNDMDYERILNDLTRDSTLPPPLKSLILKGKIIGLISAFFSHVIKRESGNFSVRLHSGDHEAITKVRLILLKDFSERPPSLDSLARESAMSVSKLKRLFRQVYGTSVYNYALKARMHKASELLVSGKYRVSDVAFLVGYTNFGQFSKMFKRETGYLPSNFPVGMAPG